jgi:hypothetical protein
MKKNEKLDRVINALSLFIVKSRADNKPKFPIIILGDSCALKIKVHRNST